MKIKKIISILMVFTILMSAFTLSKSLNVLAAELDADFGNYEEVEGESTEIIIPMDNNDTLLSTNSLNKTRGFHIPNYIAVSITPNKKSYSITVYNWGIDAVDSVKFSATVKRNNGTFLKSASTTFYNVYPGSKTWTWKTAKGDTVQEHITVSVTAKDGTYSTSASGSTVRYNFAGGKYGSLKAYDGQRHHMPSKSVDGLSVNKGAALRMITSEHKKTASYGNSSSAKNFRNKEKKLVNQGKFLQAQQLGIDDVQDKFGAKYNSAINSMITYTKSLGYTK